MFILFCSAFAGWSSWAANRAPEIRGEFPDGCGAEVLRIAIEKTTSVPSWISGQPGSSWFEVPANPGSPQDLLRSAIVRVLVSADGNPVMREVASQFGSKKENRFLSVELDPKATYFLESGLFVYAPMGTNYAITSFTESEAPESDGDRPEVGLTVRQQIMFYHPPTARNADELAFEAGDFFQHLAHIADQKLLSQWLVELKVNHPIFEKHIRFINGKWIIDKDLYKVITLARGYSAKAYAMQVLTGRDQKELIAELAIEHLKKVAGMSILAELNINERNLFSFGEKFFDK